LILVVGRFSAYKPFIVTSLVNSISNVFAVPLSTTLINLDGALPAYPGDNLATIIATAEANATIVLLPKDDNNSFIN